MGTFDSFLSDLRGAATDLLGDDAGDAFDEVGSFLGGASLTGVKKLAPVGIGAKSRPSDGHDTQPRTPAETATARLADDVVRASPDRRTALLKKLREGKGAQYTEALAAAVRRLEGEAKKQAREALADRLGREGDDRAWPGRAGFAGSDAQP